MRFKPWEVLELTPLELETLIEAETKYQKESSKSKAIMNISSAWYIAAFQRAKKLETLDTIIKKIEKTNTDKKTKKQKTDGLKNWAFYYELARMKGLKVPEGR